MLVQLRRVHVAIDCGVAGRAPQQKRGVAAAATVAVVVVVDAVAVRVIVREGEGGGGGGGGSGDGGGGGGILDWIIDIRNAASAAAMGECMRRILLLFTAPRAGN